MAQQGPAPTEPATAAAPEVSLTIPVAPEMEIVATAQACIANDDLGLVTLSGLEDDDVIQRLCAIRGIGRWSAEWVLARTLGGDRQ